MYKTVSNKRFIIGYGTINEFDEYPLYRRQSTENGGHYLILTTRNQQNGIKVTNRWLYWFVPTIKTLLLAHINNEFCSSLKSIKYTCKYVHEGSDRTRSDRTRSDIPTSSLNSFDYCKQQNDVGRLFA